MWFRRTIRSTLLAIAASLAVAFAGTSALADELKIGLVQINQQALFFTQMNAGAQAAADAAGAELLIFNANNDPASDATFWAAEAKQNELDVYAVAIFNEMSEGKKRAFLDFVGRAAA